jgi:hypothetical protein
MTPNTRRRDDVRPDPRLLQALSGALFLGVIAMLSLPAARAANVFIGWMPLWLLGMPLVALAAVCAARFARTARPTAMETLSSRRRAATVVQARRRGPTPARGRAGLPRAA